MNFRNFIGKVLNATLMRRESDALTISQGQTDPLLVERLESRMMLNGDGGEVLFEANFEDANVAEGQFGFFTSVSGFTATNRAVEIQNTHPAVGPAAEGMKHLELDGNNAIIADIPDAQAAGLKLDLQYSPRAGANVLENEIEVLWNGEVVSTLSADGRGNTTTDFRHVSIELPIQDGSTAGRLEFRSKFSGGRGVGGLLDDISVRTQIGPLEISFISNQPVEAGTVLNVDADLNGPDNDAAGIDFELVNAPVGATIDSQTGDFQWTASEGNIAATEIREADVEVSEPTTVVFADFEDVDVARGQFGFFDQVSGFTATSRAVEVQHNHPAVGPASQGNQHVELDGRNGIALTVETVPGDQYELSFDFSPRADADFATNAIQVLWDGTVIEEVSADGRDNQTTDYQSTNVNLSEFTSDQTRLEFRSKSRGTGAGSGGLIDNVRVTRRAVTTTGSANPFRTTIRATDSNGRTDTETFNIRIEEAGDDNEPRSTVQANYFLDYQRSTPADNWQYLWNAPNDWDGTNSTDSSTGEIGNPDSYIPLVALEDGYNVTGAVTPNSAPANFLALRSRGGHPGAGRIQALSGNSLDRYAIAAWTVDVSGFYAIENSTLTTVRPNGQVDVLVHVNDNEPAISKTVAGDTTDDFDTKLGFLNEGDVIYVAFGPDDSQNSDAFQHDFSIARLTGADFSLQVSDGKTSVSESGTTDSFQIVLHQQPTDDVLIGLANSDPQEVSLSTETLTFTADNWDLPQTVTLSAIDDTNEEGRTTAKITAGVLTGSSAEEFGLAKDQPVSISIIDDETLASLQSQIDQGLQAGLEQIVLTPGVYETEATTSTNPHLLIAGAKDVSIVADGVTLLATSLNSAVRIQNASNVTLEGLTIDYDPLPFSQGTVVGVASDLSWFDVRIHDGYDLLPDGSTTRAIIYGRTSRLVKKDTFARFNSSVETLRGRIVRISSQQQADALRKGDLVSLTRESLSPHALIIDRSNNVRLEDVTVHASTTFAFHETESSGNEYYNLTVTPGTTPEGATQARLLSSNYDSFHSKYAAVGPKIVEAYFVASGDDGIAINSDFALVARNDGDSLVVATTFAAPHIRAGDLIRISRHDSNVAYERTVESIERYQAGDVDFSAIGDTYLSQLSYPQGKYDTGVRLTLSQPLPAAAVGDRITNLSRSGSGFEIRDSYIANTRARGVALKAADGLVTGNEINTAATAGILVATEATFFGEAGFTNSLVIENNIINNVGFTASNVIQNKAGGIVITSDVGDSTRGHRNIQITNNKLSRVSGNNLVITNAVNVDVIGNKFVYAQPFIRTHGSAVGLDASTLVWLDNSNDISFRSNTIRGLRENTSQLIFRSSTVRNVRGAQDGLQVTDGTSV